VGQTHPELEGQTAPQQEQQEEGGLRWCHRHEDQQQWQHYTPKLKGKLGDGPAVLSELAAAAEAGCNTGFDVGSC